jgi:signal transduction histidine kinase
LNDLKDDAGLFVDKATIEAINRKDTAALEKILDKAEKGYIVEIFDQAGTLVVSSNDEKITGKQDFTKEEFNIIPSKGYGYAVRISAHGIKMVYVVIPIIEVNKTIGFVRISTPILYIEKTINRLRLYVAIIFIFATAISFLISIFLARGVSMPILEMTKIAKAVSSGNLKRRIGIEKRTDEIGILAHTFNDMLERLDRSDEERRVLLSNISHEFMTPLTTIRGFTETLCAGRLKDKNKIEEYLEIIKKESDYLEGLIEELRFIARVDALAVKYDFRPLKITDVILEAERSISLQAKEKNIKIYSDFLNDSPCIKGDYKTLKQVFINLLDNAVKYSFPGRRVLVFQRRIDRFLEIIIKDEGIGISAKDRDKIFERFYRAENDLHAEKGIGLGLAIVKEILHAHNVAIKVESQINKGSEFILTFPLN